MRRPGAGFGAADAAGDLGRDGLPLLRKCGEIGGVKSLADRPESSAGRSSGVFVSSLLV